MTVFYKSAALVLVTLILGLSIEKKEKDFSVLLTIAACCGLAVTALTFLKPVLDLLWELDTAGQLQGGILEALLKATGIALVTEIAGMICTDSGNGSLAKILRILGGAIMFNLTIPIIQTLISFVQEMLYNI